MLPYNSPPLLPLTTPSNTSTIMTSSSPASSSSASSSSTSTSRSRQNLHHKSEAALNRHIHLELATSHAFLAFHAHFARDDVSLPGLSRSLLSSSDDHRDLALDFLGYLIKRGGRATFHAIQPVESVDALFQGEADGDGVAIKVVEKALALEKAISSDMQSLVELAEEQVGDPDLEEFVQDEGLAKQQERIFKLAAVVAQMKRVGTGKGLWHWDKELLEDQEKANA